MEFNLENQGKPSQGIYSVKKKNQDWKPKDTSKPRTLKFLQNRRMQSYARSHWRKSSSLQSGLRKVIDALYMFTGMCKVLKTWVSILRTQITFWNSIWKTAISIQKQRLINSEDVVLHYPNIFFVLCLGLFYYNCVLK